MKINYNQCWSQRLGSNMPCINRIKRLCIQVNHSNYTDKKMIHCSYMLNIIFYDIKHDFRRETLNLDHKIYSRPSSSFIHPLLCYCCCKFMDIIMISYINFLSSEKGHFAEWNDIWTKRQLLFSMFSFILGCHWFFLYS